MSTYPDDDGCGFFSSVCPDCDGTGERDWLSGARCYECKGTGFVDDDEEDSSHV